MTTRFASFIDLPPDIVYEILEAWLAWRDFIRFDSSLVNKDARTGHIAMFKQRKMKTLPLTVNLRFKQREIVEKMASWLEKRNLSIFGWKFFKWSLIEISGTMFKNIKELDLRNMFAISKIDFQHLLSLIDSSCAHLTTLMVNYTFFILYSSLSSNIDTGENITDSFIKNIAARLSSFTFETDEWYRIGNAFTIIDQRKKTLIGIRQILKYFVHMESLYISSCSYNIELFPSLEDSLELLIPSKHHSPLKELEYNPRYRSLTQDTHNDHGSNLVPIGEHLLYLVDKFSSSLASSPHIIFIHLCSLTANLAIVYIISSLAPNLHVLCTEIEAYDSIESIRLFDKQDPQQFQEGDDEFVYKMVGQITGSGIQLTLHQVMTLLAIIGRNCQNIDEITVKWNYCIRYSLIPSENDVVPFIPIVMKSSIHGILNCSIFPALKKYNNTVRFNRPYFPAQPLPLCYSSSAQSSSCHLVELSLRQIYIVIDNVFISYIAHSSSGSLLSLSLVYVQLTDSFLSHVQCFPNLQTLKLILIHYSFTHTNTLEQINVHLPRLQSLVLDDLRYKPSYFESATSKSLIIHPNTLINIFALSELRKLDLDKVLIDINVVNIIAPRFARLQSCRMAFMTKAEYYDMKVSSDLSPQIKRMRKDFALHLLQMITKYRQLDSIYSIHNLISSQSLQQEDKVEIPRGVEFSPFVSY